MGSDISAQQQSLPISPVIQKLRKTIRLIPMGKRTPSFINRKLSESLKVKYGQISRKCNPICPIRFVKMQQDDEQWLSCCLVSPVLGICSPQGIADQEFKYAKKAKICGLDKSNKPKQILIKDLFGIEQCSICLILLQRPIIQLGWAGITYLQKQQRINQQTFQVINHPTCQYDQNDKSIYIYHQQINRAQYKLHQNFIGQFKTIPGSIVIQIIQNKPYIVGIQITQKLCQFISKDIFQKIQMKCNEIITKKKEKQIMSSIDIQELELMEKI